MAKTKEQQVVVPEVNIKTLAIEVEGISPLIIHRWSEKAKKEIRDKQQKKGKTAKEAKDPQKEYEAAMYRFSNGEHGVPARSFKEAAVGACRQIDGLAMTEVRGGFHVIGEQVQMLDAALPEGVEVWEELVKLKGDEPVMREDMVRVGMGTADMRYRPMYKNWGVRLEIAYNADFMSPSQIVNLFNVAGFACGIGEWRPSSPKKSGTFGMFRVKGA